jgi:hypothetical protein
MLAGSNLRLSVLIVWRQSYKCRATRRSGLHVGRAFDNGVDLSPSKKGCVLRCTGPHLRSVGHIRNDQPTDLQFQPNSSSTSREHSFLVIVTPCCLDSSWHSFPIICVTSLWLLRFPPFAKLLHRHIRRDSTHDRTPNSLPGLTPTFPIEVVASKPPRCNRAHASS